MTCNNCGAQTLDTYYFCPNCGKKLKEPPFKFSVSRATYILLLSIILPPFGIFPSFKYLKAPDLKAKAIGVVGLILNLAILILAGLYLVSTINKSINQIDLLTNPQGSVQNQVQTIQGSGQ